MTQDDQAQSIALNISLVSGRSVCLRRVQASDRSRLSQGVRDLSGQSRYLRFFSGFKEAPAPVLDRLADIDGIKHIAWGAIDSENGEAPAIAAAHAIRPKATSQMGEFALAVLDTYHGQGLARLLLAAVLRDCSAHGFGELRAGTITMRRERSR